MFTARLLLLTMLFHEGVCSCRHCSQAFSSPLHHTNLDGPPPFDTFAKSFLRFRLSNCLISCIYVLLSTLFPPRVAYVCAFRCYVLLTILVTFFLLAQNSFSLHFLILLLLSKRYYPPCSTFANYPGCLKVSCSQSLSRNFPTTASAKRTIIQDQFQHARLFFASPDVSVINRDSACRKSIYSFV